MFGFFKGNGQRKTADWIKARAEGVLAEYLRLPKQELRARLTREFPADTTYCSVHEASFKFPEEPEFLFSIDMGGSLGGVDDRALAVFGQGRYAGFLLMAVPGRKWHCSVSDGLREKATRKAKALARVFERELEVPDFSWVRQMMRR